MFGGMAALAAIWLMLGWTVLVSAQAAQTQLTSEPQYVTAAIAPSVRAELSGAPEHHSGLDRVVIRLSLSEPISASEEVLRRAFEIDGGRLELLLTVEGRADLWDVVLIPESSADLVVRFVPPAGCTVDDQECLELLRVSNSPSLTVPPATMHFTFDDGPNPNSTPFILDILKRYNARATFFVVGRLAAAFPQLIERIVNEGHTLANHTWAHDDLVELSEEEFDRTLLRTQRTLGAHATHCFRPPNFRYNSGTVERAAKLGLQIVFATGDTDDWRRPGADVITANILASAKPNAILVLHDGGGDRSQMLEALEASLSELSAQRYVFEPVCE